MNQLVGSQMLVLWEEESLKMRKEGVVQQLSVSPAIGHCVSFAATCKSPLRLFHKRYQALYVCVCVSPSLTPTCLISRCFSSRKLVTKVVTYDTQGGAGFLEVSV